MKKLLNYGFAVLAATTLLFSCGDDDNDPQPKINNPAVVDGTWHRVHVHITAYDANGNMVGNPKEEYATKGQIVEDFLTNSVYKMNNGGNIINGTYMKANDSLFVSYSNVTRRFHIDSLTTTRMVLSMKLKNDIGGIDSYFFKSIR